MAVRFTCDQGHVWVRRQAAARAQGEVEVCPQCGLPPLELPETQVLPGRDENAASPDQLTAPFGGPTLPLSDATRPEEPAREDIPGYEILQVLGRGGMGVVYCARQHSLKRLVALKMILAGGHASPEDRDRFQREAEAVARLQHPNIVQIFEVGQHRGLPYCALELVSGGTLAQFLAGHPQTPAASARLVHDLAQAVHYAHARGIVHRDLKPANILLASGEREPPDDAALSGGSRPPLGDLVPKITDFGLAKLLEQDAGQTRAGAMVGTPSYMAPEQARGDSRLVGPAADVYALGAILYELLTGRPPFRAATMMDTVQQVLHQEPVAPSNFQAKLPRDLETICLTCLNKEPEKRYASAHTLAEDLRRFLAGESIHARPAGPVERMRKWVRRRPAAAALIGVTVLALMGLMTLWIWFTFNVRDERDLAQRASERAQANFTRTLRAVEQMLVEVADQDIAHDPSMVEKRQKLLRSALNLYEELLAENANDPNARKQTSLAWKKTGDLQRLLGKAQDAEKSYLKAIAMLERLVDEETETADLRHNLADSYNWLGELYRLASKVKPARDSFLEAQRLQGQLVAEAPRQSLYQIHLARTLMNLGYMAKDSNQADDAENLLGKAVALLEQAAAAPAVRDKADHELAKCLLNLGPVFRALKKEPEAQVAYNRAIHLLDALMQSDSRRTDYRLEKAIALQNRGFFYRRRAQGDPLSNRTQAKQDLNAALTMLDELIHDFPSYSLPRQERANTRNNLAIILSSEKDRPGAAQAWALAQDDVERLHKVQPHNPTYQADLGMIRGNFGWLAMQEKKWDQACRILESALPLVQAGLKANPNQPDYLFALRSQYRDLAKSYVERQNHVDAARYAAALTQTPQVGKGDLHQAAKVFGLCINLASNDKGLDTRERQRLAKTYESQALASLREAVDRGLGNADQLLKDHAFQHLHNRPEFSDILATIRKAPSP